MYSLYKGRVGRGWVGARGAPPENFGKSRMQEKPSTTFFRLILYIFIFLLISFLYLFIFFFPYSLKFSGYSFLYFKPSLFSNQ